MMAAIYEALYMIKKGSFTAPAGQVVPYGDSQLHYQAVLIAECAAFGAKCRTRLRGPQALDTRLRVTASDVNIATAPAAILNERCTLNDLRSTSPPDRADATLWRIQKVRGILSLWYLGIDSFHLLQDLRPPSEGFVSSGNSIDA